MEDLKSVQMKIYQAVTAILAWVGLILQFYLLVRNVDATELSLSRTIINFFSYFTILTNLLVAICLTTVLLNPRSGAERFFSNPVIKTAIAVYILFVGLGYNFLLRNLWNPQGMQWVADELLHDVVPALYVIYWLIFVKKGVLQWKNIFIWLIYPLLYLGYSLLRGAVSGFYSYPFIEASSLGYPKVFQNVVLLFIAFLLLSVLFIGVDKGMRKKPVRKRRG